MKKVITFSLMSIMATVLIAGSVCATNGMRMIGFGPVQSSMGGVSVGLPLDAATVITNPAGMSILQGRMDIGASYFMPIVDATIKGTASAPSPLAIAHDGETIDSDTDGTPVPGVGFIVPVTDKIKFGMVLYGIGGFGVDYPKNLYTSDLYTSYQLLRFSPALSYKINDMVSLGVTINAMYATLNFDAASSLGQSPHNTASSFGYGATFGVLVKPMDVLQIGLAYETKSSFGDFEWNTPGGKDKLDFDQPTCVTLGFGLKPIKDLLIGFDVQWIRWSETNGKDQPEFTANASSAMSWNLDWEDQWVFKVGVQYSVNSVVTLRAGYNYGKMPLNSDRAFENLAVPAIAEHHITGGIGIGLTKNLTLNIGGMYAPEAEISGSNTAQCMKTYKTTLSEYTIDMGFSYTF